MKLDLRVVISSAHDGALHRAMFGSGLRRIATRAAVASGVAAAAAAAAHAQPSPAAPSEQSPITLRYWKCQGRGQVLRYMLHDSGHPFTDEIVPMVKEAVEALPPGAMGVCNFLPVYEGPDGSGGTLQIGQSKAILHHVSHLLGYTPAKASERAIASEVYHLANEDTTSPLTGGIWGGSGALVGAIPKMRTRLAQLETLVARRRPLTARPADFSDFAVLFTVDIIEQIFTPAGAARVLSPVPTIRATAEQLRRRPGVRAARAARELRITGCPHEPEVLAALRAAEAEVLANE